MSNYLASYKFTLLKILVSLLALILFFYLFFNAGWKNLMERLEEVSFFFLFSAMSAYFLSNIIKTIRFRLLLAKSRISFDVLFHVTASYNFLTAILPAGSGELSYPLLLKQKTGSSIGFGLHSVLVTRIADLLVIVLGCIYSWALLIPFIPMQLVIVITAGTIFIVSVCFYYGEASKHLDDFIHMVEVKTKFKPLRAVGNILNDMNGEYRTLKKEKMIYKILLCSCFQWILAFLSFYLIFRAFNTEITFLQALYIVTSLNLLSILPVNTIGGIGIKEAALAGLLLLIGFGKEEALSLGILVRLMSLLFLFILMIVAFVSVQHYTNHSTKK